MSDTQKTHYSLTKKVDGWFKPIRKDESGVERMEKIENEKTESVEMKLEWYYKNW